MIRIMIKWFHLDFGMRGNISVFDTKKNVFLAEWDVEIETPAIIKYRPKIPNHHLPPICQDEDLMNDVENMIRHYLDGFNQKTSIYQWLQKGGKKYAFSREISKTWRDRPSA